MLRAYKTKLVLNNAERSYLLGCAGLSRFVFNWGLAEWKRQYDNGEKPSAYGLKKLFNSIKDEQFPWVREYPYVIEQEAFDHLGRAFDGFFRRVKKGDKPGYPKFKSRYHDKKFSVRGSIAVDTNQIKLPVIGWVRLAEKEYLPTENIKILSANISEHGGDWFVSLQVDKISAPPLSALGEPLGIDMGIKSLAVFSDGATFDNPKTLGKYEKKLARLQRELSRRKKGSNNRGKTKEKISELHRKISDIRAHTLHNISRQATAGKAPRVLTIEDLNVLGMMKNHSLAKAVADASMGELRRQIEYKAAWNGITIVTANQWFPSSKTCNRCGVIKESLDLSERTFTCDGCGLVIDRDMNAALNLAAYGRRSEAGRIACGVDEQ